MGLERSKSETEYLWKINIFYSATPLLSESALRKKTSADNIRFCCRMAEEIYLHKPSYNKNSDRICRPMFSQ